MKRKSTAIDFVSALNRFELDEDTDRLLESYSQEAKGLETIFPVAYVVGDKLDRFEVFPYLDLSRKNEVWGYEILTGILLAKNHHPMNYTVSCINAERMHWGKDEGQLPSGYLLQANWSTDLNRNIKAMDKLMCDNGVDAASPFCCGNVWCRENNEYNFDLDSGTLRNVNGNIYYNLHNESIYDRLAIAF